NIARGAHDPPFLVAIVALETFRCLWPINMRNCAKPGACANERSFSRYAFQMSWSCKRAGSQVISANILSFLPVTTLILSSSLLGIARRDRISVMRQFG